MTLAEAQSALSISKFLKFVAMMKLQTKPGKINKHCINCGRDKHNVEMCRVEKKGEPIVATTKATNQPHKGQNNNSYVCHIYGLNGHKMMDYAEM
jgi:hypothetical protein